jgi:hypothetical protein
LFRQNDREQCGIVRHMSERLALAQLGNQRIHKQLMVEFTAQALVVALGVELGRVTNSLRDQEGFEQIVADTRQNGPTL